ncbi:FAD-dependent thymidylate synthase [Leptolyngbya sp. PCC 6406]|uniref:FAD-dependent thymidylate synthase n=1 Tax=Leptolyngbya sp. PCC 6406 TaxID=1173264 RepID=UPI0002ACDF2A|nr:FAD-dependent thymidylate synthase [Leptolyngbya sp. PCC 6406]
MDRFAVEVITQTPNPQQTIYAAMHQDYAEEFVTRERDRWPDESRCGELVIKNLLKGGRGHYGPLEHPQIVLNCGWFPHSTMQQIRTHRVGVSFDVQCLAGDTEVTFVHASGGLRKIKIAELYDLWTNGEQASRERKIRGCKGEPPGTYRRDCKTRLKKMRLRVLNEETDIFELGHIQDVMCSGLQPVYRLTLADGKTLDCTTNHRLYTSQGWQRMGDALGLIADADNQVLAVTKTCELMTNGVVRPDALYSQEPWLKAQVNQGLTAKQIAEQCGCSVEVIRHWAKQFQLKLPSGRWRGLKTVAGNGLYRDKAWLQAQLAQGLYVDDIAALAGCSMFWAAKPTPTGRKLKAHPVQVVSVEYLGMQTTYDLEVEGSWHNFVANGVVVHNSFRYTGQRVVDVADDKLEVEEVFYLRPLGFYADRQGKKYEYTAEQRQQDIEWCLEACRRYKVRIEQGFAEEHARGLIPFDVRQHWVMSANVRSLMHLLDLRWKADAQLEAQKLCECIWPHFQTWVPAIAAWYEDNRLKKARLAP